MNGLSLKAKISDVFLISLMVVGGWLLIWSGLDYIRLAGDFNLLTPIFNELIVAAICTAWGYVEFDVYRYFGVMDWRRHTLNLVVVLVAAGLITIRRNDFLEGLEWTLFPAVFFWVIRTNDREAEPIGHSELR